FTVSGGQIKGQIGSTGIAVIYNPTLSASNTISQAGGTFKSETLTLTLGLENATSGTYQIDNGAVQSYTGTKTIIIGSGVSYGSTITLKLTATGDSGTTETTYTFKKVDPSAVRVIDFSNKQTVYLWNTASWSTQNCYSWPTGGDGVAQWPGSAMTKVDTFGGYDLYKFTVPSGETNIIFNNGSTKTDDMTIQTGTVVFDNGSGKWVDATSIDEDVVASTDPIVTTSATKPTTYTTVSQTNPTTVGEEYSYGDVNLDKKIDIRDVSAIQKFVSSYITFNEIKKRAADVNADGYIDISDATMVQKYVVGKLSSFPAGSVFYIGQTTASQTTTYQSTTTVTYTQPTTTAPNKNYLYFKNTDNWTPYAYYWNDNNTGMTTWPGVAMENIGNNVYRVEVPTDATYIIFNNNGGSQTGNLNIEGYGKIYQNGGWSNYNG
ncbi:MAG: starch-binding protein, partial [Ruminococcus sp.]